MTISVTRPRDTPAELRQVQKAADKAASARTTLHAAIIAARAAGVPLRTIADAAGMSHEQVRRIAQ